MTKTKKRIRKATAYSDVLIAEGFDPHDEDFYEELNERLGLANNNKNDVKLKGKKTPSSDDVKNRSNEKRRIRQTVQGSSRNSPVKKSTKRVPTPEEKRMARIMGISDEEYLREAIRRDKAEQLGMKYVPID